MDRSSDPYKFNITVNLPSEENRAEYDLRVAKAVAKTLVEILPSKNIDELIETFKKMKKIS
jgi:ribosomal protein L12E/L44/L45/RPP1/RPP2